MFNFLEVLKRFEAGEMMAEADFDQVRMAGTVAQLVKKYQLIYKAESIVNEDPALADALFAAGLEMAEMVGIYNCSSGTIARFSREEILLAARTVPQTLTIGSGAEQKVLYPRKVRDDRYPVIFAGNAGAPMPEELFMPTAMSYMKEALIDGIDHSSIAMVDGVEVRTGGPLEMMATRRELQYLRLAAERSGRPDMPFICAESSCSGIGDLSVAHPKFIRPGDIHLCPLLSEMKTDNGNLCKVANFLEIGGVFNGSLPNPILGGYAGGPAETAIVTVASFLLANIVGQAHLHLCHPVHIRFTSTSHAQCMWVLSMVGQAFAGNEKAIIVGDIFASNGAGTKTLLYETAANTIVNTISGMHMNGIAATNGLYPNSSGLEARLMAETARAVVDSGLTLAEANALVIKLYEKYKHTMKEPELGRPFNEVYDLQAIVPTAEWLGMYHAVKAEIAALGLQL